MSSNGIHPAATLLREAMASTQPESMIEVERAFEATTVAMGEIREGVMTFVGRVIDEWPIDSGCSELEEFLHLIAAAEDHAARAQAAFLAAHTERLERLKNPRRNEHWWDVRVNQSAG